MSYKQTNLNHESITEDAKELFFVFFWNPEIKEKTQTLIRFFLYEL